MGPRRGPPRKLTDAQIRQVLAWHASWQKFRAQHESARRLAARLGVSQHVIYYCIARYRREGNRPSHFRGAVARTRPRHGRPPSLRGSEARVVVAWYVRYMKFIERTGTARALARRMGVSEWTIHDCIRRRGRYAQLSESSLNRITRARTARGVEAEILWRAVVLRRWRRGLR